MAFTSWTEIQSFRNIKKYIHEYPISLKDNSIISYRGKVKLHGTNSAVQVHSDNTIVSQSRTKEITPADDNVGFARFIEEQNQFWIDNAKSGYVYYGEWIGKSVQKNVACSNILNKSFAIFAARSIDTDDFVIEPEHLSSMIKDIPNVYILPWHKESININFAEPTESLQKELDIINSYVNEIEDNDPWVKSVFNIDGVGEGIVFYPTSKEHIGYDNFKNLGWKAKGEKHKNIKDAKPAQLDPSVVKDIKSFADLVLTDARLMQGADAVKSGGDILTFSMKNIGTFLKWIVADVQKKMN